MIRLFFQVPARLAAAGTAALAGRSGRHRFTQIAPPHARHRLRVFAQAARAIAMVASLTAMALPALAQTSPADPPDLVARLSEVSGQAWLYDPDRGEWIEASRNRPVTTGNRLATDAGAHAELQLGSTTLRLDGDTELEVSQLDDDRFSLQLHSGSVEAQVRDPQDAASFELTTADGRFVLQAAGRYRFDRRDAESEVTVLDGQALYQGDGTALPVARGQRATFWIDAAGVAQYTLGAPVDDSFARWSSERDRRDSRQPAPRYVSPEMTGAQDLERYGNWEQSVEYGAVWTPHGVPAGWAPYSAGHWAWVSPWGWTWVDDAAWGYAPFHYGRWLHLRSRWYWSPGVRVARPVYAPALVAWVGGPRVNVSISVGGGRGPAVGWFPLAPREVYVPSYRVSPRYVRSINITHVTNVTNITTVINNPRAPRDFVNRRIPHAVTVVPAAVVTGHRPVAPAAAQLRGTPAVRDLVSRPARGVALLTAPVAAPETLSRPDHLRAIQPPPGAPAAIGRSRAITPDAPSLRPRATAMDAPAHPSRGVESDEAAIRPRGVAPGAGIGRSPVVRSDGTPGFGQAGRAHEASPGRAIRAPERRPEGRAVHGERAIVGVPENPAPRGGVSVDSTRAPPRILAPAPIPLPMVPPIPTLPSVPAATDVRAPEAPRGVRAPAPAARPTSPQLPHGAAAAAIGDPQALQPPAPERMRRPTAPPREERRAAPAGMEQRPVEIQRPPLRVEPPMRGAPERVRPIGSEAGRAEAPRGARAEHSPQPAERRAEPPRRASSQDN
ncbi:MAG: DUF6600 domain-containing protein [Burkholderiaceae bacterium]